MSDGVKGLSNINLPSRVGLSAKIVTAPAV
jgi:hypothetical protein